MQALGTYALRKSVDKQTRNQEVENIATAAAVAAVEATHMRID